MRGGIRLGKQPLGTAACPPAHQPQPGQQHEPCVGFGHGSHVVGVAGSEAGRCALGQRDVDEVRAVGEVEDGGAGAVDGWRSTRAIDAESTKCFQISDGGTQSADQVERLALGEVERTSLCYFYGLSCSWREKQIRWRGEMSANLIGVVIGRYTDWVASNRRCRI